MDRNRARAEAERDLGTNLLFGQSTFKKFFFVTNHSFDKRISCYQLTEVRALIKTQLAASTARLTQGQMYKAR